MIPLSTGVLRGMHRLSLLLASLLLSGCGTATVVTNVRQASDGSLIVEKCEIGVSTVTPFLIGIDDVSADDCRKERVQGATQPLRAQARRSSPEAP